MRRTKALLGLLFGLCAGPVFASPLPVMVSVSPQKYFVEKIAGSLAEVSVMVTPGADAHTFEPKPSQMTQAAGAKLYLAQGVEFEHTWLPRLVKTNPQLVVVDTLEGVELMPMAEGHGDEHGHNVSKGKHSDKEMDVHTWTSPSLVKMQASTIARALAKADPNNRASYEANLTTLLVEIDSLDAQVRTVLKGIPPGAEFIVFHTAWAYFARDYGLKEEAIESGGKEPGPRKLKEIIEHARESRAKAVFVQPQFSRKAAQTVADAIGAKLVEADDLAEDWGKNILRVAKALGDALR
jgi:zinc transport system substrate-binding protein